MTAPTNIDTSYMVAFQKTQAAKKTPYFINARGDNQYIWVYSRNGFETGLFFGCFPGVASAVYYRKMSHIPLYALGFGISYAAFHASSAYFRNEI